MEWYIGCSGFHYKHWRGVFYPEIMPERKWFEHYCGHFKTVELNVTFYRFPQLSFLQGWYQNSPANFRFAVKAPKAITHYKKFNDTTRLLTDFYNTVNDGLQDKLGCLLFQMPPNYNYTTEKLDKITAALNPAFYNFLELRHSSWWVPEVYDVLTQHNITFCGMSHPHLPDDVIANTPLLYYRLHGVPHLYRSRYSVEQLQKVTDHIDKLKTVKQAFIYFNNDIDASAVKNAHDMMAMV